MSLDRAGRVGDVLRRLGYGAYFRAVAFNYEHRLFARPNRTPAGSFRCYELLNRHRRDRMLAAVDRLAGPDAVVYDVGAHVGMYALGLACSSDRRVHAFEPVPSVVERLRANVARNECDVTIHDYALGEEDERRTLYVSTYPELSGFSREGATRWGAQVRAERSVAVSRLDGLELPAPDVVKIDVEGAAPAVLRGGRDMLEDNRPTVVVEIHDRLDEGARLAPLFEELGYDIDRRDGYWVCRG